MRGSSLDPLFAGIHAKIYLESAAIGLHRAQTDRPALVFADTLDQRQAQAETLATFLATAHKRLEHRLAFFFGNTYSRVLDDKTVGSEGKANETLFGVMQCVTQQVAITALSKVAL